MLSERVARLRQHSLDATPTLSDERARLLTEFYKNVADPTMSTPMRRALAFQYLMEQWARLTGIYHEMHMVIKKL